MKDFAYICPEHRKAGGELMSNKGLSYVAYALLFALILYVGFGWGVA